MVGEFKLEIGKDGTGNGLDGRGLEDLASDWLQDCLLWVAKAVSCPFS